MISDTGGREWARCAAGHHQVAADISQPGSRETDGTPREIRMKGHRFTSFISGRSGVKDAGRYAAFLVLPGLFLGTVVFAQGEDRQKQEPGAVPPGVRLESKMPAAAPTKPFHFPEAAAKVLTNGLRTYVISSREEPMVAIRLTLTGAGSVNDPSGRPGVANMTADMLTQGTASRSAEEIAQAIDFVGGRLGASADDDGTYISVTVVKKDFALAMDLLSDVLLHPTFRQEELDRRRRQALSDLEVQYSDPEYIADVLLKRLIYGEHPYGLPGSGTPDSLQTLDRGSLVSFRDSHYVPDDALLSFAGDITPDEAFAAAEKYLGEAAWHGHQSKAASTPGLVPERGIRIVLVDKPDANQTQIWVGRIGIPRNSPDYLPLYVTNRIFGGGFNSRLSTEVRQKKGLTYDAYSQFECHRLAGDFSASTFTRTSATVEAAKLVVDLIRNMSTGELGPRELDFARDYIAGVFPIQTETAEQVASRTLAVVQYGLPEDYNATYQQKVLAVSPAEVKKMAGRYFDANDLTIVLVGNVKEFRDAMHKAFPGAKYEELAFDQVDLLRPDLRKAKHAAASGAL
jgi:zinc protease